jgi:hypothetical protein
VIIIILESGGYTEMNRRFLVAKVNINGNILCHNVQELIDLIPDAIKSKYILKSKKSQWTWEFTHVNEFPWDNRILITGYFIKSRKESKTIVKDNKLYLYEIPEKVAYPSFFIYDPLYEILIFEETGDIQRQQFIDAFERIIYQANLSIGKIEVELLPKKDEVYKHIHNIEYLTKIEFDLVHPNGFIGKDAYKDLEELIRNEKATRMKVSFENEKGLDKNGVFIQSGIEMVSRGYGQVNAYGFNEVPSRRKGKKKKEHISYKSRDSIYMAQVNKNMEEKDILSFLSKYLDKIRNLVFTEKRSENESQ